ncbi:hypothetical protein GW17_00023776 [Ensete ventricosum]|nr:hypothetical protein GW17_00023776 [Ensete ventricosum]
MEELEEEEKKRKNQRNPNPQHQPPNPKSNTDLCFKPSRDVKGIRFGGQAVVKTFAVRRASPLELLRLLNAPPRELNQRRSPPFPSTATYVPTNFTVLAQRAWRTLTLGLGAHKSKLVVFVFESEAMKSAVDRLWPAVIPLGNVNKQLVRGLAGCELARFKTFYVFTVRRAGVGGFGCVDDLRRILEAIAALKDFVDLTTVLAWPTHRRITSADAIAFFEGKKGSHCRTSVQESKICLTVIHIFKLTRLTSIEKSPKLTVSGVWTLNNGETVNVTLNKNVSVL